MGGLAQLPAEVESVHLQALPSHLLNQIVQSVADIGDTPSNQEIDEDSSYPLHLRSQHRPIQYIESMHQYTHRS